MSQFTDAEIDALRRVHGALTAGADFFVIEEAALLDLEVRGQP